MHVATESTYNLADLKDWPRCVDGWPAAGVALAVIGHPIAHSLSPVMHNAALTELAKTNSKFNQWRYFKFDIAPAELEIALALFHKNKFRGLNLTVPHKALVVPHLDLKDTFVQDAGAANTLRFTETWWQGFNTDGIGLSTALREELSVELKEAHIILLGAGGAARAAAVECLRGQCTSLWIGNRTQSTLSALFASLKESKTCTTGAHLEGFDPQNPPANLPANSIVINATSLGLKANDGSPLNLAKIPRPAKVFDMIYRPPQTALLSQADQMKIPCANGLSMLVYQGARSLELWTGENAPVEIMQLAVRTTLSSG
jgi:shikimate dehydrogenase